MVGANVKAETMALMEKRESMEADMNAIIHRLSQSGGPGVSGSLLDSEGFPRDDIDIPAVRAERLRLAELRNDHKEITDKINANIEILHSVKSTSTASSAKDAVTSLPAAHAMDVDVIASMPFAVVDEITELSPAAEDGLQLGDQVVRFGNVEAGDDLLQRLAAEAHSKQGQPISAIVIRQGALVNVSVTPRIWQGRGLLGCHFRLL